MSTNELPLFTPATIGAIDVANRVAMAPLTRSRADMQGVHSELAVEYYRQRASAGLIISEATNISQEGRGYAFTPGIYTKEHVAAWRKVTDAVHAAGGKIVCQLWHVGRMSHVSLQANGAAPVAPSAIQANEQVFLENQTVERPSMPRALEIAEIARIVNDYRHAAQCAKDAGFDGVEVHAANCYLLEQFIRDSTNQRTDEYGGSVQNRTRLPIEVVTAVAEVWGSDRVGVRLSPITRAVGDTPLDSDPEGTYFYLAEQLGKLGLAYLHCVEGQTRGDNAAGEFDFKKLHAAFGGKYIANNSYDRQMAIEAANSGHADMVAFGRPFISNPDLVERLRRNAPLTEADHSTFYGGGAGGYTDYATLS
ncbi:N-ethylmaleimide reductase [Pseudoduganella sp. FT26W]|uniref:N-ethylmaleimide reductase n=1 Tax=Duganella aquatilis TaxID=2666082 RepID=A0A844CTP9_9BURK|nr:alkene reductase [Duganella aquatilis]MRW84157.1 N-ethylmaleimide reductase [Duganella aquatilis]